jgi:hypothetical protein
LNEENQATYYEGGETMLVTLSQDIGEEVSMRRGLFVSCLLFLSLPGVLAAQQSATGAKTGQWEKFLGTWKRVPGPDGPGILRVEPEGAGVKFSFTCKEQGSCLDVIVGNYDGKRYTDAGLATWEATFRKTGDRVMQEDDYLSSNLRETVRWQLSSDGKTLTRTYHNINPPGSKDFSYVYERSGGPVAKDDPFIGYWKSDWNKSDALLTIAAKGAVLTLAGSDGLTVERNCDGEDHPLKTDPTSVYSCRVNPPSTYETVFKKNQNLLYSTVISISDDGKKLVRIIKNIDGTTSEQVFEKVH